MIIDEQIYLQNPWFRDSNIIPRENLLPKRQIFSSLLADVVSLKQIISLTGLRRVGKSTLLKQIIAQLLQKGENSQNIFYFSFDQPTVLEETETLENIITYYLKRILSKDIHRISHKIYFFLDEIQLIPFWQDIIKRFYDINQQLKFVVSGSSSLFISEKSKESLAGRIFKRYLPPLYFSEYKSMRKNQDIVEYLDYGQFPEMLEMKDNAKKIEYLKDGVIGKVLEVDIIKTYGVRKTVDFERLFWALLPNTGQIISSRNLISDLQLKKATFFKYLSILEKSLLIDKTLNLSGSFRSEKRLLRKIYPGSSNFLMLTAEPVNIGFKAETYINSLLKAKNLSVYLYNLRAKEIDFILPERKIAIEVKYQEKIHQEDLWFLKKYIKEKKYHGIVVTKNYGKEEKKDNLTYVPMGVFEEFYI